MKRKKSKSAGRFGARYGRRVRTKIAEIESIQRKKQKCLFCRGVAKRLSKGIWQCKKCRKKFASHAFYLPKREE
jgi:large subunit ribosomal protein L37Ae